MCARLKPSHERSWTETLLDLQLSPRIVAHILVVRTSNELKWTKIAWTSHSRSRARSSYPLLSACSCAFPRYTCFVNNRSAAHSSRGIASQGRSRTSSRMRTFNLLVYNHRECCEIFLGKVMNEALRSGHRPTSMSLVSSLRITSP